MSKLARKLMEKHVEENEEAYRIMGEIGREDESEGTDRADK